MKYEISESFIKERKKIIINMGIMMMITIFLLSFYYIKVKEIKEVTFFLKMISIVGLFLIAEMSIVSWLMLRKIKSTTLIINEDNFIRQGGKTKKSSEVIYYNDITSAKVIKKPNDDTVYIKLKLRNKRFNLTGFNQLDELVQILKNKGIEIEHKKWKIDWNSVLVLYGIGALTLAVIIVLMSVSNDLYDIFNKLFMIGFGSYFLFGKAISKNMGKRFRILEYILGILLIGLSIFNIIIGN